MLDFLIKLGTVTLTQFFCIFGSTIFLGLILFLLARFTRKTFVKTAGSKFDMFFTGWIGTPVHELGHAIFCLLFLHKIEEIRLFHPDSKSGTLGYVNHTYNKKNLYQRIGNFFIGVGPILFGSFVLILVLYFIMPENNVFTIIFHNAGVPLISIFDSRDWLIGIGNTLSQILFALFTPKLLVTWQFWLFFYISVSISSHMELSPSDLKSAFFGLISFLILFVLINVFLLISGIEITQFILVLNNQMFVVTNILILAVILSGSGFVASYAVLSIYSLIKNRKIVNPFWG